MQNRGNTFKIFVGNLSDRTTGDDLRKLFEEYGTVAESDVISDKNFGFVHMESDEDRKAAIDALNGHNLFGRDIVVEASTGNRKGGVKRTKIFIGNLHKDTTSGEIRDLFEAHGKVTEADVLSNFAFVHMENEDDARTAIESLDGTELHGLRLRVAESTSRDRRNDRVGDENACHRCGRHGHWAKDCRDGGGGGGRGRGGGGGRFGGDRFDSYGGPPPRGYDRDRMMRPIRDDPYSRYGRYDDPYARRPMRDDPYDRRPLPRMRDDPYDRRPMMPPMRDSLYERRLPPLPPSKELDYMSFGRRSRSPPPRMARDYGRFPPPPPPPIRGFLPARDRSPF